MKLPKKYEKRRNTKIRLRIETLKVLEETEEADILEAEDVETLEGGEATIIEEEEDMDTDMAEVLATTMEDKRCK